MEFNIDNLYLYDPEFEAAATRFLGEEKGINAAQAIKSSVDIERAMDTYSMVRFLVFDTHGLPGKILLDNGWKMDGTDFLSFTPNQQFLRKEARILFYGCNVGEGSDGNKFMDDVGKYLLRGKGGFVGASTAVTISFMLGPFLSDKYMAPLSFGRVKVKRYDVSGAPVGSRSVTRHNLEL